MAINADDLSSASGMESLNVYVDGFEKKYVEYEQKNGNGTDLFRPFIGWNTRINSFEINFGTGFSFFRFNETNSLTSNSFSYSDQSQLQNPQIYYSQPLNNIEDFGNEKLEMTKSNQLALSYRNQINDKTIFKTEIYYQTLSDVPVSRDTLDSFSSLNYFNENIHQALVSEGSGKNYGIEITAQQYFSNNTLYKLNKRCLSSFFGCSLNGSFSHSTSISHKK